MLMTDLRNAIIFSKGVSLYRLPEFTEMMSGIDFDKLSTIQAEETELRRLFRAEFDPNDRHFDINRLGIWRLRETYHRYIQTLAKPISKIRDSELGDSLQFMESLNGKIFQYINISESTIHTNSPIDDKRCEKIYEMLESFRNRKSRIIYVDDMADTGWSAVLSHILWGNATSNYFRPVLFEKSDSPYKISEAVKKTGLKNCNLLILDLRLKDERGYLQPSRLSGLRVLHELEKTGHLSCPVLIFTASDKIWSLRDAFRGNVVSYYMKEGIYNAEDGASVDSFLDLMEHICFLTEYSWLYKVLAKLRKLSASIREEQNKFWWETLEAQYNYTYPDTHETRTFTRQLTNREDICEIIDKTVSTFQKDMRDICFFKNQLGIADIVGSMLINLSKTLEEIHRSKEGKDPLGLFHRIREHLPGIEMKGLTKQRNFAAHTGFLINEYQVVKFVDRIISYLLLNHGSNPNPLPEETTITPVEERLTKLINNEDIFVEVLFIGVNGFLIESKNHGYFYNFNVKETGGETTILSASSKVILEGLYKDDPIQVRRNPDKDYVPGEKMQIILVT
ncbi:MAG: hypothetical protein K6F40_01995 [Bacteroidales bacterium]|nr:hypothetical protein [Bacteroidales bacterium]